MIKKEVCSCEIEKHFEVVEKEEIELDIALALFLLYNAFLGFSLSRAWFMSPDLTFFIIFISSLMGLVVGWLFYFAGTETIKVKKLVRK
jgi:hypothetical protein